MLPRMGVALVGGRLEQIEAAARVAAAAGFEAVASGDSQSLYQDVYVRLSLIGRAAPGVRIGPWVTNPVTRHPAVTASAVAALWELSGGRSFLGIGTGDSSVANLGLPPASLAQLEDYVKAVRALWGSDSGSAGGATRPLRWFTGRIPVGIGASGPRALRCAGRIADEVWVLTGALTPQQRAAAIGFLEEGTRQRTAGLALSPTIWWVSVVSIGRDEADAIEQAAPDLATFANAGFRMTLRGKGLPLRWRRRIERFLDGYDPRFHVEVGENPNSKLLREYDLLPFLAERVGLCGTPREIAEKLERLAADGVEGVWFWTRADDQVRFLSELAVGFGDPLPQ